MKKIIWLILPISIIALQCEKENLDFEPDGVTYNLLTGTWAIQSSSEDASLFKRVEEFGDEYGFSIHEYGRFVEHASSSGCGTPPITYADYEGTWEQLNDSTLKINVGFWGGVVNYELKIVDVSENTLQAIRSNTVTVFAE